jgi:hypothetical protein
MACGRFPSILPIGTRWGVGTVVAPSSGKSAESGRDEQPVEATFFFRINRLWVRPDLLDVTHWFERDGYQIAVDLPSPFGSFSDEPWLRGAVVRVAHNRNPTIPVYGVELLRARVRFNASLSDDSREELWPPQPEEEAGTSRYDSLLERAFPYAQAVTTELLNWIRVIKRQWWLGLSSEPLLPLEKRTRLTDLSGGRHLPARLPARPAPPQFNAYVEDNVVGVTAMHDILERIKEGGDQPPPDILLADATVLAERRKRGEHANLQVAVLLAAIACEVKLKRTLEDNASSSQRPLLKAVLRDSRGAERLFGRLPNVVLARSLGDEDNQLYQRIRKLFEARNAIAHRGSVPSDAEALDVIEAASAVFQWVESLPALSESESDSEPQEWWDGMEEPPLDDA